MEKLEFFFWLLVAGNVGLGIGVWATAFVTDDPWETVRRLLNLVEE